MSTTALMEILMKRTLSFCVCISLAMVFCLLTSVSCAEDIIPSGPVNIGTEPHFLFDNYIVDNHWTLNQPDETVRRVFHPGRKYESNPVIAKDGGYVSVLRDKKTGKFRMWYQTYMGLPKPGREDWHEYVTSYAESQDGLSWKLPKLGLIEWEGTKENNYVWRGVDPKWYMGEAAYILEVPAKARREYRYVMFYHDIHKLSLVGSHDGIHWDKSSVTKLTSIPSDTHNTIVYDPRRDLYSMYMRSRPNYSPLGKGLVNKGYSRRVARMTSKKLWTNWDDSAQNILIPDEQDADQGYTLFYGMPVKYFAGIYWGFLWPYKPDTFLHTELAWSRDGIRFDRLPGRPKLISRGPKNSWDYGIVLNSGQWIEVGDEWWIYYCGNNGPHSSQASQTGIGLVKFRKEGFISMHGPKGGGYIATRKIRWSNGSLVVNADAHDGELLVRVTDENRKVIPGFDYSDCIAFNGDAVSHDVKWKKRSIGNLKGHVIRLEFSLRNADLYTFRASGKSSIQQ
jgi:hypothetical protein